jgi:hypothetical protein
MFFARVHRDNFSVEGEGGEFYWQRFVHFKPRYGQPSSVLQANVYRHLVPDEGVVGEAALDVQVIDRPARPKTRQQVDGEKEIGNGEEKVHAQDGGDEEQD